MFLICVILGGTRMDTSAFSPGHTICDTLEKNTAFFFFGQEEKKTAVPLFASSCSQLCPQLNRRMWLASAVSSPCDFPFTLI